MDAGFQTNDSTFIVMPDGCRLAARLYVPALAIENPCPVLFEYNPYRLRDGTSRLDSLSHPWFAANGYIGLRVDIRGSGDSDGIMVDEYSEQELNDAVHILNWLQAQAWCDGSVAMIGISWGGFNALQIAALNHPALKTVICVAFSDDRYADDVHYMGGCLLTQNFGWSMAMTAFNSRPPDPALYGEGWRAAWRERMEHGEPFIAKWLAHQVRDAYWKRGSVCEDYSAISIPVLAVSGWADPYSNAVPRLVSALGGSSAGLIGPWAHNYPHLGVPGPAIDFLSEVKTWCDQHLRKMETSSEFRRFRYWVGGSSGGHWRADTIWPPHNAVAKLLFLGEQGDLSGCPASVGAVHKTESSLLHGSASGIWCPTGHHAELPVCQNTDDLRSDIFDTDVLSEPLTVVGAPVVRVTMSCDRPSGFVCARLCDVSPDGSSALITYGVFNLTHLLGHDRADPITPGKTITIAVKLNDIAYRLDAGHRIRLSLATSFWPLVWPSVDQVRLQLSLRECYLQLATIPSELPTYLVEFQSPPTADGEKWVEIYPPKVERRADIAWKNGRIQTTFVSDTGLARIESNGTVRQEIFKETYDIDPSEPLSAVMKSDWRSVRCNGNWNTSTQVTGRMTASRESFFLEIDVSAFENCQLFHHKQWRYEIPRTGA